MENSRYLHLAWKEWVALVTVLVNSATLILRTDIKGIVYNGWNWLYFLSCCIIVIYLLDLRGRVRRWANGIALRTEKGLAAVNDAAKEAQSGFSEAIKAHLNSIDSAIANYQGGITGSRVVWEKMIEDTVQEETKRRIEAEAAINRRLGEIVSRLPPVGVS
jgi:hypothetical protein